MFWFSTMSILALQLTQPPICWVVGALSLGIKQLWGEADLSSPSSAEVELAWSYTSSPSYIIMLWCLIK
jgi:hypothetical protein